MVTPAGDPAFMRTAGADTYGGVATLRNLGDIGAVNAKTDVAAEEYLRIASDLARCVQTAPLFWMRMLIAGSSGSVVTATVQECVTQWAGASGSYAGATPPSSSFPTISQYFLTGTLCVSFPGLVSGAYLSAVDDYGVAGTFQLAAANGGDHSAAVDPTRLFVAVNDCADGQVVSLVVY